MFKVVFSVDGLSDVATAPPVYMDKREVRGFGAGVGVLSFGYRRGMRSSPYSRWSLKRRISSSQCSDAHQTRVAEEPRFSRIRISLTGIRRGRDGYRYWL